MKDTEYRKLLSSLFSSQALGVLSTQQNGRPYANLVAFASTEDLSKILFTTSVNTRKYKNLIADAHAALLIDSRANTSADFRKAVAVTACGAAAPADTIDESTFSELFITRHPHMRTFVEAPTTSVFVMDVEDYTVVDHFQHVVKIDVSEWKS